MAEVRVCVGAPAALRSTVWKLWTRRGDAYVHSRMMGRQTKVSLHQSGQGQWSLTSEWAEETGIPPAHRHINRWQVPQPANNQASHVFRVILPFSELHVVGVPRKSSQITWLDTPSQDEAVILECYFAPISWELIPQTQLPYPLLAALPLGAAASFVVVHHRDPLDDHKRSLLETTRQSIVSRAQEAGLESRPEYRAAAFLVAEDGARGFIEIAPFRTVA